MTTEVLSDYVTVPRDMYEDAKRWRSVCPRKRINEFDDPAELRARLGHEDQRWVHDQLARYCYKPTFTAEVGPVAVPQDAFQPVTVHLRMWVLDSRGSGRVMPVSTTVMVPPYIVNDRDEDDFMMWLRGRIQTIEDHEADEWFRRDGQLVDDPHARAEPSKIGPIK